jgi:hypothetical protein
MNQPVKREWPKWATGPLGNRAIFHCRGDVVPGWVIDGEEPVAPEPAKVVKLKAK